MLPVRHPLPILVVDDDASVRRGIARLLHAAGYEVATFGSATELLTSGALKEAGCLLLDVRMPGIDGLELQRTVTRMELPYAIVFISGHNDVPATVSAMKSGAIDFLVKPVDERDLLAAVERAMGRTRSLRQQQSELAALRRNYDTLTPREREVCALVTSGLANKQIAAMLGTTEKTVKVHRARATSKLNARSLAQLVRIADRLGLQHPA
jgi:FixJ family two-component response regulator